MGLSKSEMILKLIEILHENKQTIPDKVYLDLESVLMKIISEELDSLYEQEKNFMRTN